MPVPWPRPSAPPGRAGARSCRARGATRAVRTTRRRSPSSSVRDAAGCRVRRRSAAGTRSGLPTRAELAEPDAVGIARQHLTAHLEGETGLPDAPDSGHRDDAIRLECRRSRRRAPATDRRRTSTCSGRFVGKDSSDFSAANSLGKGGMRHLEHALGASEITQAMFAEIDEVIVVVPDELGGRERHHDLVTVGDRHEPCRAVQRRRRSSRRRAPRRLPCACPCGPAVVRSNSSLRRAAPAAPQWRRRPPGPRWRTPRGCRRLSS